MAIDADRETPDTPAINALIHSNLGDGCLALAETLLRSGRLQTRDAWSLIRTSIEANKDNATQRLAQWLPEQTQSLLNAHLGEAKRLLKSMPEGNPDLELALITEIARKSIDAAEARLESRARHWPKALRAEGWLTLSAMAARKLDPIAVEWAERAQGQRVSMSDDSLAWITRAALRSERWPLVAETIQRMSAAAKQDPTWIYWQARALAHAGQQTEAQALYEQLASGDEFYHLLAREELGLPAAPESTRQFAPAPEPLEIDKAARLPGLKNAFHLLSLDIRPEGVWEFNRQLQGRSDSELLAIAAVARKEGFLDRMITAADRTKQIHDYRLRYPTPMRDILGKAALNENLSPHWVYGLIRQESRFTMKARSSVGASGLMQLMPATARMVAKKIGLDKDAIQHIDDPEVNAKLGTAYLRQIAQQLDQSAPMATAAYNAGPGRPKQWRANLRKPIEGAAFAESIPFTETRDYVKKVLTNTVLYAATHDGRNDSLKQILGEIGADEARSGLKLCCQ